MMQIKLKNLTFGTYRPNLIPKTRFALPEFSAMKFSRYLKKHTWGKVFMNEQSKICRRHPLKNSL